MPANPNVYQPDDGHPYTPSPWPSLKDLCDLCAKPKHQHVHVEEKRKQ